MDSGIIGRRQWTVDNDNGKLGAVGSAQLTVGNRELEVDSEQWTVDRQTKGSWQWDLGSVQ